MSRPRKQLYRSRRMPRIRTGELADQTIVETLRDWKAHRGSTRDRPWVLTLDLWKVLDPRLVMGVGTFRKTLHRLEEEKRIQRGHAPYGGGYAWKAVDVDHDMELANWVATVEDRLRGWGIDPERCSIGGGRTTIPSDQIVPRPDCLR